MNPFIQRLYTNFTRLKPHRKISWPKTLNQKDLKFFSQNNSHFGKKNNTLNSITPTELALPVTNSPLTLPMNHYKCHIQRISAGITIFGSIQSILDWCKKNEIKNENNFKKKTTNLSLKNDIVLNSLQYTPTRSYSTQNSYNPNNTSFRYFSTENIAVNIKNDQFDQNALLPPVSTRSTTSNTPTSTPSTAPNSANSNTTPNTTTSTTHSDLPPPQLMSRIPSAAPAAESPTSLTGVKKTEAESEIEKNIKKVIEEKIAAGIQADGGDIHFVGYIPDKQLVEIALTGACESCDRSAITLQILVTNALKHYFPGDIEKVKRVYLPGQEQH
jgi:Fe-S cluster biogenesis protein NfuA